MESRNKSKQREGGKSKEEKKIRFKKPNQAKHRDRLPTALIMVSGRSAPWERAM